MKTLSKYTAMLVLVLASSTALAHQHETPLALARQIASLTAGGPYDPAPPVPASDIVHRDDARPR